MPQNKLIKIIKLTIFMLSLCALMPSITYAKSATYNQNIDCLPVFYVNTDEIFMPIGDKTADDKTVISSNTRKVIPGGMTVGIRINTGGVMVVRMDCINDMNGTERRPSEDILQPGDLIISANGVMLENKEELQQEIINSNGPVLLSIKRDGVHLEKVLTPIRCSQTNTNKIGAWVRDSTQGIGTLTYINPDTMKFGALGHGIMDIDTKKLMIIDGGEVWDADVRTIKKGRRGVPGELVGDILIGKSLGKVRMNNAYGLYGVVSPDVDWLNNELMYIAPKDEVVAGPASILTNIGALGMSKYDIIIESLNTNSCDNSKGLVIRIVDEELLGKTNGIVQGMSGSPIIQDGKLIGAITHVFVQEPTKGYGIFIEHMMEQEGGF